MSFDVDAHRAAHPPWTFVVGTRRFTAKPVSTTAAIAFHEAMAERGAPLKMQRRALFRLLRCAFPSRLSYHWRGDPVRLLFALEPAAQRAALDNFFLALQGKSAEDSDPESREAASARGAHSRRA